MSKLKIKHRTRAKLTCFDHCQVWYGYLTPVEILEVYEAGGRPSMNCDRYVGMARSDKKEGKSPSRWFYFTLPKGVKEP